MRPFLFGEKMKFIDIFAGIGGFRSGLERAGHQCVGYIEWDKFARKSYQAIYKTKGEYTAHDIQQVKGVELPEAAGLVMGAVGIELLLAHFSLNKRFNKGA